MKRDSRSKPVWRPVALAAAIASWGAGAQAQEAPPPAAAQPAPAQKVIVTGSNIRRTDAETPSPVETLTADDIARSGYTNISDVLHSITANNMGSLTQATPGAFAAGGSGVSLRGLSVGATLVLIDGHRMASYPMPDDGERDFVDISSIPMGAVERIEVLKDGASAVYGSDAMAGVVNVILKKSYTGTEITAEGGATTHGDGVSEHAAMTHGWGDLEKDGHNAFVSIEGRHQDAILLRNRGYLTNTNWTSYGGLNMAQGTASPGSSGSGSGTGYLLDPNGNPVDYYAGCTAAQAAANSCGYTNPYMTLQPETNNIDLLGRYTLRLNDDWTGNVSASFLRSEAHEVGLYNNVRETGVGSTGANLFNFGPGQAPVPASTSPFPTVLTVPANYPGNTTEATAPLVYDFTDIGPQTQTTATNSYRLVGELGGSAGDWDVDLSAGLTRVTTLITLANYIDFPAMQTALDDQTYLIGGNNSAVLGTIAPSASSTSWNDLEFASARGTRELTKLPGGPLSLGTGVDFFTRSLHQEYPQSFVQGQQAVPIYSFAVGKQTVEAAYAELVAPVLKTLEFDAAARADHYDGFGFATTPKAGFKFSPIKEFTLRGTVSRGFRAPNVAETGQAGSTSGYVGYFSDPVYCPNGTPLPNLPAGMNDPCNIAASALQLSSQHLSPEKSQSFTLGVIVEPSRYFNMTLDYYNITIRDQIISVGQLGQQALNNYQQYDITIYRDANQNMLYYTYPFINANTTQTSGLDLDLVGNLDLHEAGHLKAELQTTYMLDYNLTAQGVTYHLAGTHGPMFVSEDTGTPRTRGAFTLTWSQGAYELSGTANYISGFSVTDPSYGVSTCAQSLSAIFPSGNVPSQFCHVSSFTEINMTGKYSYNDHLSVRFGIINLFNRKAPLDLQTWGSVGNGAGQGGAPYNPAYHQDGAVGTSYTLGGTYTF